MGWLAILREQLPYARGRCPGSEPKSANFALGRWRKSPNSGAESAALTEDAGGGPTRPCPPRAMIEANNDTKHLSHNAIHIYAGAGIGHDYIRSGFLDSVTCAGRR